MRSLFKMPERKRSDRLFTIIEFKWTDFVIVLIDYHYASDTVRDDSTREAWFSFIWHNLKSSQKE